MLRNLVIILRIIKSHLGTLNRGVMHSVCTVEGSLLPLHDKGIGKHAGLEVRSATHREDNDSLNMGGAPGLEEKLMHSKNILK